MAIPDFRGLGVALITPFKTDKSIDFEALGRVVDRMLEPSPSVDYILVLGTTAETPTLSADERDRVKNFVAERVAGRVPLVLGVGGNNTAAVCEMLNPEYLRGYDAILSVAPYYNKPNQRGMLAHFSEIARQSPLPIILYNIPGRTGVNMLPDTILKLANQFDNIIGVKEASGKMDQISYLIENKPEGFAVISGDDALTLEIMKKGGDGVISVIGNAFPSEFKKMTDLARAGKHEEAAEIDRKFATHYKLLFVEGNPAGIKCMLDHMGIVHNVLRLPLVPVGGIVSRQIADCLTNA